VADVLAEPGEQLRIEPDLAESLEQYQAEGAGQATDLATSPLLEGIGGRYFEDCNEAALVQRRPTEWGAGGVAPYALDPANADRLWETSLRLLA